MKGDKFMTAVEFAQAMDYDYSTVMRWLRQGIVPGAKFVEISGEFGVWQIPESALKKIQLPRPGRKRRPKASGVKKAAKKKGGAAK
jgi:hypothetical protein